MKENGAWKLARKKPPCVNSILALVSDLPMLIDLLLEFSVLCPWWKTFLPKDTHNQKSSIWYKPFLTTQHTLTFDILYSLRNNTIQLIGKATVSLIFGNKRSRAQRNRASITHAKPVLKLDHQAGPLFFCWTLGNLFPPPGSLWMAIRTVFWDDSRTHG